MSRALHRYLVGGTIAWFPMPALAVLNAALREFFFLPLAGPEVAQTLSGVTLIALLAAYVLIMFRTVIGSAPRWAAWLLGAVWAGLTLAFEYALIASSQDRPFEQLLQMLSPAAIADGNLFAVAVLFLLVAPRLACGLRSRGSV